VSLLAMAVDQSTKVLVLMASSRTGSFPQGPACAALLWERACSRRRRHIQHRCDWHTAFASKPAPTGVLRCL